MIKSQSNVEIMSISKNDIPNTAKVYAEVFAGRPWFEVSKCDKCGEFSSAQPEKRERCTHCTKGRLSLPAYPAAETQKYIKKELGRLDAVGLLAVKMKLVEIGFGWGYAMTGKEFAGEKYKLAEMQELVTALLVNAGTFFYVSEVGVVETAQGHGIGKQLTHKLMDHGKRSQGKIVLRTNEKSSMRYIAENAGMKPVVGLDSGKEDTENGERVIFVSEK